MEELKYLKELVEKLSKTNSSNEKKKILKSFQREKGLMKLLKIILNKDIKFNITSDNLKKRKDLNKYSKKYNDIFYLLNDLSNRVITGYDAISATNEFIDNHKEYEEIIYRIIDKNLKVRMGRELVNQVFKNLVPKFSVSLANKYEDPSIFDGSDWYVSTKFDGIRVVAIIKNNNVQLFSRRGKELPTLVNLKKEIIKLVKLKNIDNIVLDGEVCLIDKNGNEDFQSILKLIRRKNFIIEKPKYLVFDMISIDDFINKKGREKFSDRYNKYYRLLSLFSSSMITPVKQEKITTKEELDKWIEISNKNKWEGLILRKDIGYEGKRSKNMLKVKSFLDQEFKVIDVVIGPMRIIKNGKEIEKNLLSAVKIKYKNNIVSIGSGFKIEEREYYYKHPEEIINKTITVKYFEETKNEDGLYSLRFPIVKAIHGDKRYV